MKRWLFNLAAALSLLLSIAAAAAWAMSYTPTSGWRLIGTAHSADLTRVDSGRRTVLFTTAPDWSKVPNHGFWDAWWALSRSGRLTLLAQVVDYDGTLRRVYASPPSLVVDLPAQGSPPAVVFGGVPDSGPPANRLGFAWHSDAQLANDGDGIGGPVSARAWMVTLPYWFILLLGLPMPLWWLRVARRRRDTLDQGTMLRSLCLFPLIVLPVYALTFALLNRLTRAHSTGTFWADLVGSAAVGWWVPIVLLPAALALHGIAQWLPGHWSTTRRRMALLAASPLLCIANFAAAAFALTGEAALLESPYVLIVVVPALVYGAVLRTPARRAI